MTGDDMDRPESEAWGLVVPFVACQSQGGPYDDQAFVAGFQAGDIDRALVVAAAVGATRYTATVPPALVKQLELVGMHRGFPTVRVEPWAEHPEDWVFVTFVAQGEEP